MEINARVSKNLNQLRIQKRGLHFTELMTVKAAREAWEAGKVTTFNKTFQRLVDNDFDVEVTLAWYQEERERLREEARDARES